MTAETQPVRTFEEHLLAALRARGFEVRSEGEKLFVEPWKKLEPLEISVIKAAKFTLLNLLALERAKTCRKCKASYDPNCTEDLIAICDRQPCALRSLKK